MAQNEPHCILCKKIITGKTKPEHILLNALGGRATVRNILCSACNHKMGIRADQDLADNVAFWRNVCDLKAGDGGDPPTIHGLESNGQRFDLKPGMKPHIHPQKPLKTEIDENGVRVNIQAFSDSEAEKLIDGAARKIAKHIGYEQPIAIEMLKSELRKDKKSSLMPSPSIHENLQFGQGQSQQSMAKGCLVLWAKKCGNEEISSSRYDSIRSFILTGIKENNLEKIAKIDTRTQPQTPEKYGTNPIFIWVGSDETGKVYGYYRLYGAIGWRFLLCESEAPTSITACLISNSFNNLEWEIYQDNENPISSEWIMAEWNSYPPLYDAFQQAMEPILKYAHQRAHEQWLMELIESGFHKAGCKEGDIITEDIARKLADHVSRAIVYTYTGIDVLKE
jgi:hypothetical protein